MSACVSRSLTACRKILFRQAELPRLKASRGSLSYQVTDSGLTFRRIRSSSMSETVYRSISGSTAEDLFIELFSETFGAEKAGYLYSQYHFYDIYQNDRFADFFLESGTRKIAIEIDDEASHNKNIISQNKCYDDLLKQSYGVLAK